MMDRNEIEVPTLQARVGLQREVEVLRHMLGMSLQGEHQEGEDSTMEKKCECGCGQVVKNRFVRGHNTRLAGGVLKNYHTVFRIKHSEEYYNQQRDRGRKGGTTAQKTLKRRGVGIYDPKVQLRLAKARKEKGIGFHNHKTVIKNIETQRRKKTGLFNPSHWIQKIGGRIGGRIGGHTAQKVLKEKRLGVYDPKTSRKGGLRTKELKVGYMNPLFREICRIRRVGIYNPKVRVKAGLASIRSRRENYPYCIGNVPFDSNEERQAMLFLCERFNIKPIEGVNCHIRVNGGEIDFRPTKTLFVEYHPWDRKRTPEQYYENRRKLLDKSGFHDCRLVVVKSLKELEGVF